MAKPDGPLDAPEPDQAGSFGMIRVVIADDHAVVRRGLRQVLRAEEGFEVVAEASDLDGARRYVRGSRRAHSRPELARDTEPQGDPGDPLRVPGHADRRADDVERARIRSPGAQRRRPWLRAQEGRRGRAGRGRPARGSGDTYLNPRLDARVAAEPPPSPPNSRSEREAQVPRLIALGHTNNEIADELSCRYAR